MFEWYKKQRLNEQVKFFGGDQKRFISCYAKYIKPRIKIKLAHLVSPRDKTLNNLSLGMQLANQQSEHGTAQANIATQSQLYQQQRNHGMLGAASSYNQMPVLGVQGFFGGTGGGGSL